MGRWIAVTLMLLTGLARAAALPDDPLRSPMWEYNLVRYLGDEAQVVIDDRVALKVPGFAEDSAQVPLTVDLSAFPGPIRQLVSWVDFNPVPLLFKLTPEAAQPRLIALNFRVQQATAVRVAAQADDGRWHIGSADVDAAGGGCTAPSMTAANPDWQTAFGTIRGGAFSPVPGHTRFKFHTLHPMDSGMVGNVPAFRIDDVRLHDLASDRLLLRMRLAESAAENPMFVFELAGERRAVRLWMRDNNGNLFERELALGEGG
ncbi:quinoprotein dehydrogenase-associated SoxYZ-like carrier [Marinobacter xestospongiae]|uniref:quinoprotein dehydrogenase-associated SoxYZ-like carrier n=1 Tax=Marinobacter xestospongiae TaxID=994319 RepID=UPI0020048EBD|nr:quinoprotein dehydrogenase-associated SoxYZ-like carrier [Marinobacter xestospongiae]MCK7568339.1 quinoprotein dehydrogenase-associated SoxYZ-like carrier [Marinobacter xestospongiae]